MKSLCLVTLILAVLACSPTAAAQEGHPMSGSWVGEWGPSPDEQHRVVVVLEWTGTELAGTINPGRNAIPIRVATVDPDDWSIHIEADAADAGGRPVTYVIDGKIDDIGTYNRTLAGTWNVGGQEGNFSITRQ